LTVSEFLSSSTQTLQQIGIENPQLEAQVLLSAVIGIDRNRLLLAMNRELPEVQLRRAERFIELRSSRLPLQYITENVEFLGLDFSIVPGVFIPRPETELLVIEAAERLELVDAPSILEVGTGSGVVAVVLATRFKEALVYANDISRGAIEVARENASTHGVSERILFFVGDLFTALTAERFGGGVDVLVSNPPYIPSSEIPSLAPEVCQHEPIVAIDGGEDGLRFIKAILEHGPAFVAERGWLVLEIGIGEAKAAADMAASAGLEDIRLVKDLSRIERVLVARKP